jgi:hypothetical protein
MDVCELCNGKGEFCASCCLDLDQCECGENQFLEHCDYCWGDYEEEEE